MSVENLYINVESLKSFEIAKVFEFCLKIEIIDCKTYIRINRKIALVKS